MSANGEIILMNDFRQVSRSDVKKLIAKDAEKLGVSVWTALRRVRSGKLGSSILWADISALDVLIHRCHRAYEDPR